MAAETFYDLQVSSAGTVSLAGAVTVSNDLSVTAGTLSTGAFSLAVGGNALLTGALNASGQTGAQTTTVGGSMSGAGSFTMANGTATPDVDIDGAVSVATFTASAGQVNIGGNFTSPTFNAAGGTVLLDTTAGSTISPGGSFANLTVAANKSLAAATTVTGTLSVTAGTLSTGAFSLAVGGNALLTGALDASGQTGAQTTTVGGSMSGAGSFTMADGTLTPDVDIDGAVSVATFTASAGQVNIGGNFTSPTFNPAGGTVLLDTTAGRPSAPGAVRQPHRGGQQEPGGRHHRQRHPLRHGRHSSPPAPSAWRWAATRC